MINSADLHINYEHGTQYPVSIVISIERLSVSKGAGWLSRKKRGAEAPLKVHGLFETVLMALVMALLGLEGSAQTFMSQVRQLLPRSAPVFMADLGSNFRFHVASSAGLRKPS